MNETKPTPEAEAERLLPCSHDCEHCWPKFDGPGGHAWSCRAALRPDVVAALRQKDDENEQLRLDKEHLENVSLAGAQHEFELSTEVERLNAALDSADRLVDEFRGRMAVMGNGNAKLLAERDRLRAALENAEREIQVRDNQITQLLATNDKHVIALENAEREKKRLWEPMECGHPGACYSYIGPADNNPSGEESLPKPCLTCRALAAALRDRESILARLSVVRADNRRLQDDRNALGRACDFFRESLRKIQDSDNRYHMRETARCALAAKPEGGE